MTPEQRGHLLELHQVAIRLHIFAGADGCRWPEAHAADKAFTDYLYSIGATP